MQTYQTNQNLTLVHCDLYRISDPLDIHHLALEEYTSPDTIMSVEWANRIPETLQFSSVPLHMTFAINADATRSITITNVPSYLHEPIQQHASTISRHHSKK